MKPTNFKKAHFMVIALLGLLVMNVQAAELSGLKVGQKAPSFVLETHEGKAFALDELRKEGPVAIVFYRSADW